MRIGARLAKLERQLPKPLSEDELAELHTSLEDMTEAELHDYARQLWMALGPPNTWEDWSTRSSDEQHEWTANYATWFSPNSSTECAAS